MNSLSTAAGDGRLPASVGAARVAAVILDLVMAVSILLNSGGGRICMGRAGA